MKRLRIRLRTLFVLMALVAVTVWFLVPFPLQLAWTPTGRPPKLSEDGNFYYSSIVLTNTSRGTVYYQTGNPVSDAPILSVEHQYSDGGIGANGSSLSQEPGERRLLPGESIEMQITVQKGNVDMRVERFCIWVSVRRWFWDRDFAGRASQWMNIVQAKQLDKPDLVLLLDSISEPDDAVVERITDE